ncbi:MAG: beta strand repeat-containing protein, partial [Limisphaerales bacterium]
TNGNGWFDIVGALNVPSGNFVLNGGTTNSGTITVGNGGSISVNDNLVLNGAGGIMNLSGGAIDIAGGHGISGDNGAEFLSNQGQINSSGGYIQSVPGFTNSGEINLLTGTLNLDSDLQLQSSGSLNSQLNSASDYGKIVIAGNAALNGAFDVTLNYSPAAGDAFTPLTYGSYAGNISLNLPALGTGQSWQSLLGATALTLQIAESVNWTNTAGGNWSVPNNWSPNKVPGQFDDVGISTPGTYTVIMDPATVNIRSLALGTGGGVNGTNTLAIANKTFYVNPLTVGAGGILTNYESTFHAVITVQNGGQLNSLNGTYYVNPLTATSGGSLNSFGNDLFHGSFVIGNGGIFNSTGAPFIENDGSLTVDEGGTINLPVNVLYLYGPMTNSGTVSIASNGGIYIYNNGTTQLGYLVNQPGGVVNLNGNNGIQVGPFINQGSVISTGNGALISSAVFDTSAGTVTNLNGTLYLSTFTNTLAGIFYATNNATIQFNGGTIATPLKPGNPLTLAGNGIFQFHTGWLDFPTNIISNLDLRGGFLELEPTFQGGAITNLALDGINLTNLNQLPVTNGILAATNGIIYGNLTVQNSGQLNASGTQFHANVTVAAGGQFITSGAAIESDGSLTMDGTLNLIGSGVLLTLYGPMTNSGTINLPGNSGIYIYDNQTASYLGGLVNLAPGIINITGNNGIQGGGLADDYFLNQGTVNSTVGGQIVNIADFTNAGAINSFSGTMTIHPVTLLSSGSLNVRLNSKTDYGKFSISGDVALNGTFGVTLNGYLPTNGTSFNV